MDNERWNINEPGEYPEEPKHKPIHKNVMEILKGLGFKAHMDIDIRDCAEGIEMRLGGKRNGK